jgi:ubiquinone/menaquinone biosynthesis C-methylase UbiE
LKYPDIIKKTGDITKKGVILLTDPGEFDHFQELYQSVRSKEHRLFSDSEVKALPYLNRENPLYHEWLLRAYTMKKFDEYIKLHKPGGLILDIGCGNGWFTGHLCEITSHTVIGLDINILELEQAARVFKNEDLSFIFGNVFEEIFYPGIFHLIVLNASIQYFQDLNEILDILSGLLHEKGEIHLLDSPFYSNKHEALQAKERTLIYYAKLGFPEMAAFYYHHHYHELTRSGLHKIDLLYNPKSLRIKLLKTFRSNLSPFPWIRITRKKL